MIKRRITNYIEYKDKLNEDSYLTTTKYHRKMYLLGIKLVDHQFEENTVSSVKDVTSSKSIGFSKSNKNS